MILQEQDSKAVPAPIYAQGRTDEIVADWACALRGEQGENLPCSIYETDFTTIYKKKPDNLERMPIYNGEKG